MKIIKLIFILSLSFGFQTSLGDTLEVKNLDFKATQDTTTSIQIQKLNHRIDSLESIINDYAIAKDLISNDLTIYIALSALIMLFFTIIISFIIPKGIERKIEQKFKKLEDNITKEISALKSEQSAAILKIIDTNIRATRSLYENSSPASIWRFIWSIRLCDTIHDKYQLIRDAASLRDLKIRLTQTIKDLNLIENLTELQEFENLSGIKAIFSKLLNAQDSDIRNIALDLMIRVKEKTGIERIL